MRIRLGWIVGLIALLLILSCGVAFFVQFLRHSRCTQNAYVLMRELEHWNLDHEPADTRTSANWTTTNFADVVGAGYLPLLPTNPFTGRPMRELKPGDTNQPGDFRFVTADEIFEMQDGSQHREPSLYKLVVYLSSSQVQLPFDSDLGFSLGREEMLVLSNGYGHRGSDPDYRHSYHPPSEVCINNHYETWDDALRRQGYW